MHVYVLVQITVYSTSAEANAEYKVAKMHMTPFLDTLFPAKEPYNYWLFGVKRPATSGIQCIFATL